MFTDPAKPTHPTPQPFRSSRRGHFSQPLPIVYCYQRSNLGNLILGATTEGLCFLQFGPSEAALLTTLQSKQPTTPFIALPKSVNTAAYPGTPQPLQGWANAIGDFLNGENHPLDFPLAPQGTEFQRKVWAYLRQIPYGQVQSYRDVAMGIGQPGAIRAVASACAANQVALAIPCHRVIRSNGQLGGYRWGLALKQALLTMEKVHRDPNQTRLRMPLPSNHPSHSAETAS